jgi:hypothetical protein
MRREPSASDLLRAWELGLSRPPLERPLVVLDAVELTAPHRPLELPVGRRDTELLKLRRELFGPHLVSLASCPSCGESLELSVDVEDVLVPVREPPDETYTVVTDGHTVTFRLPTTRDVVAARDPDVETTRLRLLELCVVEADVAGTPLVAGQLPAAVVEAISERMREADPQAQVELDLACPGCGHRWREPLDIGSFLWEELDGWARRLLQDVASLAKAYGWTEADVVALSPARRQAYLELSGA